MKKSLIALAVLAASGASFAQVSITGNLVYGYQSTSVGAYSASVNNTTASGATQAAAGSSSETAGFGAETANIVFTAKEDLGGGYSAAASLKINTKPQAAATGDDHSLTLVTPVGALTMGTAKDADYLSGGIAGVGAYYTDWSSDAAPAQNKLFTPRTSRDFVAYTVPVGAVTLSVFQKDQAAEVTFGQGTTGAQANTSSFSNGPLTGLSATYTAGPLVANGQYLAYKNPGTSNAVKDVTRLSASYDLGMVKLGAGASIANHNNMSGAGSNPKTTDYLLGAKIPMGASSFGVTYASRNVADVVTTVAALSSTATGYSLEYGYAMSKRTSVIANYARWTPIGITGVNTGADATSQYNVLLAHSF